MEAIIQLIWIGIMVVVITVALYALDRMTFLGKMKFWPKQIIIGLIFGGLAIFGTEFGVPLDNRAIINARDAAPLCAGLIFGGPAGVIAGVIGGVERFFAAYWGAGFYSQIACSVACIVAGVTSALLRNRVFDQKVPSYFKAFAVAVVVEVFHMLLVFITNMQDVGNAFDVVKNAAPAMITMNSLTTLFAVFFVRCLGREQRVILKDNSVLAVFQRWLLAAVIIAFVLTTGFVWCIQNNLSIGNAKTIIELNIETVRGEIVEARNGLVEMLAKGIRDRVNELSVLNENTLSRVLENDAEEINIIDRYGIIQYSTKHANVGKNIGKVLNSVEVVTSISNNSEKTEFYQTDGNQDIGQMRYVGLQLKNSTNKILIGFKNEQYDEYMDILVGSKTSGMRVGEQGYVLIANRDAYILSDSEKLNVENEKLSHFELFVSIQDMKEGELKKEILKDKEMYCMYKIEDGFIIFAAMPKQEAVLARDIASYVNMFQELVVFGLMFVEVYFLIKRLVMDNINKINKDLTRITEGDLDVVLDVRKNVEFKELSDHINSTVDTLKGYIKIESERINKELEFAKDIQHSALPSVFPPFPERTEFDLYASMDPAKEVGGDFYDFFFAGDGKMAILVADVSGKGIPAAMFMMTAKTLLRGHMEAGESVEEAFITVNEKLCENNAAGMFVTAWLGVLDLRTGELEYANAGHNPPLLLHENQEYEYLKVRSGFVLAGMEGIRYQKNSIMLQPGDAIYLYTDGVTEATNSENELYGEDRLLETINQNKGSDARAICSAVKEDVDRFVGEAEQFDDITMLSFKFIRYMD